MKFSKLAVFVANILVAVQSASLRKVDYTTRTPPAVAVLHGMGDSCLNTGMISVTDTIKNTMLNSFVHCFVLGDSLDDDVLNTFIMTMNEQVDMFAEQVKNSASFAEGFNAIGFSQGNLIIRGYVQKYAWKDDYPDVFSFMSIHGPLMGVGAVPYCDPTSVLTPAFICDRIANLTSDLAYTKIIQNTLAQANYLRDPMMIEGYLTTKFLPFLNKEKADDQVKGWHDLKQVVLVKGLKDKVVVPRDSEWMGFFQDGSTEIIEDYDQTIFYKNDMFGLKTLDEEGKLFFETTPAGHVEVTRAELVDLLNKYWLPNWKWENKVILG